MWDHLKTKSLHGEVDSKADKHEIKKKHLTLSDQELVQVTDPQDVVLVKSDSWSINLDDTSSQEAETNFNVDIESDINKEAYSESDSDEENDIKEYLHVNPEVSKVKKDQEKSTNCNDDNIDHKEEILKTQMNRM
ncbi:hypothetical protein Tco_0032378 [Tanacetum coccineum]